MNNNDNFDYGYMTFIAKYKFKLIFTDCLKYGVIVFY